jgi:hypothetical protein
MWAPGLTLEGPARRRRAKGASDGAGVRVLSSLSAALSDAGREGADACRGRASVASLVVGAPEARTEAPSQPHGLSRTDR